jgi:hypothetical protein
MLALWEYFWDWAGAPVVVVPEPITPGRGSGKSTEQEIYQVLPDEYWEAYAEQHKVPEAPSPEAVEEREARLLEEVRLILMEQAERENLLQIQEQLKQAIRSAASTGDFKVIAAQSKIVRGEVAQLEATLKARIVRAKRLRASLYQ